MFLLVPKRAHHHHQPPPETETEPEEDPRAPVRTQNACDSCRVKKAKCNGKQPCTRCATRRDICVYSRATRRDVPVTPAQVALLQHQKDRMSKALQQMASVISKHETGQDKTPASFDVPNLLDKYAPTHSNKRERDAALDYAVQASKRNCIQPPRRPSAPDLPRPSHTRLATYEGGDNNGRAKIIDTNAQFVLEPGPAMQQNAVGNNAFESMLQFMQMMGTSGASSAPDQALNDSSQLPAQNLESIGVGSTAALSPSFIDLVDWEASLANFPDSILNFGNPLPSDNNNNNFVNHEDNSTIESTMDNDDALMRLP